MKYAIVAAYAVCMLGLSLLLGIARQQSADYQRAWKISRAEREILHHGILSMENDRQRNARSFSLLEAENIALRKTDENIKESLAVWVSDNFVLLEKIGYPGYVEQDDKTPVLEFGGKAVIPEWYDTVGLKNGQPLTEDELLRHWKARDGTVFKVVPKGELPH